MDGNSPENTQESVSLKVGKDAMPVCPNCFQPCDPLAYYCPHCGSNDPINPAASYMPLESVRFQAGFYGKLWRRAGSPQTQTLDRCINIMLLLLFCPFIIVFGVPALIYGKIKQQKKTPEEQDVKQKKT